jgi:hypothetical protein
MKRKWVIVLVFLGLLIAGYSIYSSKLNPASVPIRSDVNSTPKIALPEITAISMINWKTYVDTNVGFSFKYPQNWKKENGKLYSGKTYTFLSPLPNPEGGGGPPPGVYVYIEENKDNLSSGDYINQVVFPSLVVANMGDCAKLPIYTSSPVEGNVDSTIISNHCDAGNGGWDVYIHKEQNIIHIVGENYGSESDKSKSFFVDDNLIANIISTFKFTK